MSCESNLIQPNPQDESAGTLGHQGFDSSNLDSSVVALLEAKLQKVRNAETREGDSEAQDGRTEDEGTLDWQDVIQLQAFSERRVWIDEKIAFLENLPPIEVFVGLDAVRASSDVIPGLPTRGELQTWLDEHDRIEKEIMIFDSGELNKLREVTRVASRRNLSREDTDLIEMTLTTIYRLDKLLHLLRARANSLDMLGIRLTWEENRMTAWAEHRKILDEVRHFLETRARWSLLVYENMDKHEELSERRDSVASSRSDVSRSSAMSVGYPRTVRFKWAEGLSREAAQLSGRVSSLRFGKIAAAGKTLDKLIDHSSNPIPDELLDEQDKLEAKGVTEMENVGKFVMNMVSQWKKADDMYVETMKDYAAAQTLVNEIEAAQQAHPTIRQATAFVSRADALVKRLQTRGNSASLKVSFPRPAHPLFPDQQGFNDALIEMLTSDVKEALGLAKRAETLATEYADSMEAVKQVDALSSEAQALLGQLDVITQRLMTGVPVEDGDGSPPDLTSEHCLDSDRHSAFLALLPSVMAELDHQTDKAETCLRTLRAAILKLDRPGIDSDFKAHAQAAIDDLVARGGLAKQVKASVTQRVAQLRDVRKIWGSLREQMQELEDIYHEVGSSVEREKWTSQYPSNGAPPTPESPAPQLPASDSGDIKDRLKGLRTRFEQAVLAPVGSPGTLGPYIHQWLQDSAHNLSGLIDNVQQMIGVWDAVRRQAGAMVCVQKEVHDLEIRVEDQKSRYESAVQRVLGGDGIDASQAEVDLGNSTKELQDAVQRFNDGLHARVPFVDGGHLSLSFAPRSSLPKRQFLPAAELEPEVLRSGFAVTLPFDATALDGIVRTDCNSYSARLAGGIESLSQKVIHLQLAQSTRDVDAMVASVITDLSYATEELENVKAAFSEAQSSSEMVDHVDALISDLDDLEEKQRMRLSRSLSLLRERLRHLEVLQTQLGPDVEDGIVTQRVNNADDLEAKVKTWTDEVGALKQRILDAQRHEAEVRERERLEEEARVKAEEERLEAEERIRVEQEKLERERSEREQKDAEDAAEKARIEQEMAETQERLELETQKNLESAESPRLEELGGKGDILGTEPVTPGSQSSLDMAAIKDQISSLRKRLSMLGLERIAGSSSSLPTVKQRQRLSSEFAALSDESGRLPSTIDHASLNAELQSLREELRVAQGALSRIHKLADLSQVIQDCDNCLSDLLEHIDSYPAPPAGELQSSFVPPMTLPPEEQLSARLSFVKSTIDSMNKLFEAVSDDPRATGEHSRVLQTWEELEEMGTDRLNGQESRPSSVISSGRSSRSSVISSSPAPSSNKKEGRSRTSLDSSKSRYLVPPAPSTKRVPSSSNAQSKSRPSSRLSTTSIARSVSGSQAKKAPSVPVPSTFTSRQRTISSSSNTSSVINPVKVTPATPTRPRTQTLRSRRSSSPAPSEASSRPSTASHSTWSRVPRPVFPFFSKDAGSPKSRIPQPVKKPYIPNPKVALDVKVADVVNSLPVDIKVEYVPGTWKDQSGKYWIGDLEPKLCFCRILRSQTVMVRVGGGWMELSKFIKTHFADTYRLLPDSPPHLALSRDERWISSKTLLESPATPPVLPRTPENDVPRFSLHGPGKTPSSMKSTSSHGSPLTPLQFMRRTASPAPRSSRPQTPTKPASPTTPRARKKSTNPPARNRIWRP